MENYMRLNLLFKIKKKGITQRQFARLVGDHETVVSRVINGWWNIDDKHKERYAKVLETDVDEIFGDESDKEDIC
jgi:transcriptional regulator with XRE-family HTH domain